MTYKQLFKTFFDLNQLMSPIDEGFGCATTNTLCSLKIPQFFTVFVVNAKIIIY